MFVVMAFNPISILFSSDHTTQNDISFEYDTQNKLHRVYSYHRTLQSIVDDPTPFDDKIKIKNNDQDEATSIW